ncbi:L,D-transpeptidase [Methylocapsa aurea]|uniref:L,D-transpeptidase n=1 Tax=Methylocapsa aurea TaxID=663610 RepID=UPI00138E0250|nr:L,D-transpeptidase [Methylocapsa aurea]
MRIPSNQAMRTAFLLAAMAAASVSFAASAHAGSGSRRTINADAAGVRKGAVLVNIDKTSQTMTVFLGGVAKYQWPASTGRLGYSTPSGTYNATSMNEIWYSKQWENAPMPHSIFFIKDGHAIHGSLDVKNLGRPVSHGCVRISPKNAAALYALVKENGLANTQVMVTGVSPGGEYGPAGAQTSQRSDFFAPSFGVPYGFQGR